METVLQATVREVDEDCPTTGQPTRCGSVLGATDGTFLHAWAGLPIGTLGPGNRTLPHQGNGYVPILEMADAARVHAAAVLFLGGSDEAGS